MLPDEFYSGDEILIQAEVLFRRNAKGKMILLLDTDFGEVQAFGAMVPAKSGDSVVVDGVVGETRNGQKMIEIEILEVLSGPSDQSEGREVQVDVPSEGLASDEGLVS